MELAMYEACYVDDVPVNVAIHEAVLLAQKFEEPETVSFVNGVLGSFARDQVTER
jgi:N utilization substance protein B